MSIITLTSDWGLKDHYVAAVKGKIWTKMPDIRIVDISHQVRAFNIEQAAFIVKNCYKNFPENTIHVLGISSEESDKVPHVVILYKGQYFIGADNGIFSMIFDEEPEKIIELNILQETGYFTFSTRDRFVKAALHIAQGKPMEELGSPGEKLNVKMLFKPVVDKNLIKGMVIHIDAYENLITNITEDLVKKTGNNRKFTISIRGEQLNAINKSYRDVPVGEIVAVFASNGHLEIAINQGNAGSLLGMHVNDTVRMEFY